MASVLRRLGERLPIRQGSMGELTIREMEQDGDFAAWYSELIEQEEDPAAGPAAARRSVTSFSATRSATGSGACATGCAAGWPTWWMWWSCRRSGTAATPTGCWPPSRSGRWTAGPTWRSSGPTMTAPRACWPPWAGTASSARDDYMGRRTWSLMEKRLDPVQTELARRRVGINRTSRTIFSGWSGLH